MMSSTSIEGGWVRGIKEYNISIYLSILRASKGSFLNYVMIKEEESKFL